MPSNLHFYPVRKISSLEWSALDAREKVGMERYYLLDRGFPYFAVLTTDEAAALFASVPPERRDGSLANGFQSWELLENGLSQATAFRTYVDPIPPDQLATVCRQLGWLGALPEGLAPCE